MADTMQGMTLDEMRETRERLREGLADLRQQVLRQEGAVMILGELIEQREKQAAQVEPEVVEADNA